MSALLDVTRAAYDTVAGSYAEALPDVRFEDPLDLAMIGHLVREMAPGSRVLDAGCGTGRMIDHLATVAPSSTVSGVDVSRGMLAVARASHPGVQLVEGDLAALPFGDREFDGVLAWYSIIHTPARDLPALLHEFRRVLRPGGLVLLAFQAGEGERAIDRPYGHDVELQAFLHDTALLVRSLDEVGMTVHSVLERGPRTAERYGQGFVLARRPTP